MKEALRPPSGSPIIGGGAGGELAGLRNRFYTVSEADTGSSTQAVARHVSVVLTCSPDEYHMMSLA